MSETAKPKKPIYKKWWFCMSAGGSAFALWLLASLLGGCIPHVEKRDSSKPQFEYRWRDADLRAKESAPTGRDLEGKEMQTGSVTRRFDGVSKGDTIKSIGSVFDRMGGNSKHYNIVILGRDTVAIEGEYLATYYYYEVYQQASTFRADKSRDPEIWSRAVYWINKHSNMKIQTQSDLIIQTYTPIRSGERDFSSKTGSTVTK